MITKVIQVAVALVAKNWRKSQNDAGYKQWGMVLREMGFDEQTRDLQRIRLRMAKCCLAYEILIKNKIMQNQYGLCSCWDPRKSCWCCDNQFSGRRQLTVSLQVTNWGQATCTNNECTFGFIARPGQPQGSKRVVHAFWQKRFKTGLWISPQGGSPCGQLGSPASGGCFPQDWGCYGWPRAGSCSYTEQKRQRCLGNASKGNSWGEIQYKSEVQLLSLAYGCEGRSVMLCLLNLIQARWEQVLGTWNKVINQSDVCVNDWNNIIGSGGRPFSTDALQSPLLGSILRERPQHWACYGATSTGFRPTVFSAGCKTEQGRWGLWQDTGRGGQCGGAPQALVTS